MRSFHRVLHSSSLMMKPSPILHLLGITALMLLSALAYGAEAAQAAPEECLQEPDAACFLELALREQPEPSRLWAETLAVSGLKDAARQMATQLDADDRAIVDIIDMARSGEVQKSLALAAAKQAELEINPGVLVTAALAWHHDFDEALAVAGAITDAESRSAAFWHIAYAQVAGEKSDAVSNSVREALTADAVRDLNTVPLLLDLMRRGAFDQVRTIAEAMPARPDDAFIHMIKHVLKHMIALGHGQTVNAILLAYGSDASGNWSSHYDAMLGLLAEIYAEMRRADALKILDTAHKDALAREQYLPLLVRAGDAATAVQIALKGADDPYRLRILVTMAVEAHAAGDADALQTLKELIDSALGDKDVDPSDLLAISTRLRFAAGTGRIQDALKLLERADKENRAMFLAFDVLEAVAAGGDRAQLATFLDYVARNGGIAGEAEYAFRPVCEAIEADARKLNFEQSRMLAEALLRAAEAGYAQSESHQEYRAYDRGAILHSCQYYGGDLRGAAEMAMAAPTGAARAEGLFLLARGLLGY